MFDNILVEVIKLVGWFGGLVGLASGIFLIYDRVTRGQPLPYLIPTRLGVQLCLRNVTRETLVVDRFAISPAGMIAVAKANDLRSEIKSVRDEWYEADPAKRTFAVLRPEELRQFPLKILPGLDKATDSDALIIACAWRNTRRPWPFPRHVKIKTTVRDIRELHKAGEQDRYSADDASP